MKAHSDLTWPLSSTQGTGIRPARLPRSASPPLSGGDPAPDRTTALLIGYTGHRTAREVLLDGLSVMTQGAHVHTGLAVHTTAGLRHSSHPGPPADLSHTPSGHPGGSCGIAAANKPPTDTLEDRAAQPHTDCTARVAVAYAGGLDNRVQLRRGLQAAGHLIRSDDDAEIVAHIIEHELEATFGHLLRALLRTLRRLHGRYALIITATDHPDTIVAAQLGVPLIAARAGADTVIANHTTAINTVLAHNRRQVQQNILNHGQTAELRAGRIHIRTNLTDQGDENSEPHVRPPS